MLRIAIVFGIFGSFTANAAPTNFYAAVASSDEVKALTNGASTDLESITHTQTGLCPGCYEFVLKFRGGERRYVNVATEMKPGSDEIKVRLTSPVPPWPF